jgi:anti-sigma B factor antagonist
MSDDLVFRIDEDPAGPIVRLFGEIDVVTADEFRDHLLALADLVVTVDFCGVTFMDCTGVTALVVAQQRVRERGGKLVLFGVRPQQMRVLGLLGMTDYFDCMVPD